MRLKSFQLVGKTPLDSDWLHNQVSGAAMSSASSFKSLAVTPSGPGLLDGSRFNNTFWTSVTESVTTDNLFLVGAIRCRPGGGGSLSGGRKNELT